MRISRRISMMPALTAIAVLITAIASAQSSYTTISGEMGPGALYEISMPTAPWNGELVIFAHGIRHDTPDEPVALPAIGPVRDFLTRQGFAVAVTSRSVNGYGAIKDGMQRTHQLRGIFTTLVGEPTRVYLWGRSLGGLIVVMLAEFFPEQYDGVLSGCGLLGGGPTETTYIGDARVLFDYFFPGIIPGTPFEVPNDVNFSPESPLYVAVESALTAGLTSPGQPTLQFAKAARLMGLEPKELLTVDPLEIVTAGRIVVQFTVNQANGLVDAANGIPYDNSETTYSGSDDDTTLNANVARYVAKRSAANYVAHYYTPVGDLRVPVITLHKRRDPLVPFFHQDLYAEAVQGAGASQYLLQLPVAGFGHCGFPTAEMQAFSALAQWVRTGVKPQN